MAKVDFSDYKFHCSSLGRLMTTSRDKKDPLGETCKKFLMECYVEEKYGRKHDIISKLLEKGVKTEQMGITIYSVQTGDLYFKNEIELSNEYICGTPDIFKGPDIYHAEAIKDIKCPYDIFNFFGVMAKPISSDYKLQINGYQVLSGAKDGGLVYTLVSTPDEIIEKEINSIKWKMGIIDPDAYPEFIELADRIRAMMRYDDIPENERWIEFSVPQDLNVIDQVYEKAKLARAFLNNLR